VDLIQLAQDMDKWRVLANTYLLDPNKSEWCLAHVKNLPAFFIIKPTRCINFTNCRAGPGWNCSSILVLLESCLQTCMTHTIAECTVQWINSWWWTEELSETCRVSCQNKFVKLMHLVGFIIRKFVTMHGHMNVKNICQLLKTDPTPATVINTYPS
jgi:hypothetical protein